MIGLRLPRTQSFGMQEHVQNESSQLAVLGSKCTTFFSRSFPFQPEREREPFPPDRNLSFPMVAPQHSRRESVTYILTLYVCIARRSRSQTSDVALGDH